MPAKVCDCCPVEEVTIKLLHKDGIILSLNNMAYMLFGLIIFRLAYWLVLFSKLARYKPSDMLNRKEGVSVVICVKNNKVGLEVLLNKLLKQNHENYEIVVVDDFSTDGVKDTIENFQSKIVVYCNPIRDVPGKKMALTKGIEMSKYQWILVTDSDCVPSSLDWISLMVGKIVADKKEIVLGYGPLSGHGFVEQIAKYEAGYIAMQYLSYALAGIPYMGVGRNMVFKKSLFLKTNPFQDNYTIASGDDDMFIQKAATVENTSICIHANAQCKSPGPKNINDYLKQKIRHASTSQLYNVKHKFLLGLFAILHLGIYFLMIAGILMDTIDCLVVISSWVFMTTIMLIIQYACFAKLNERRIVFMLFVSDFLLSLLYCTIGLKTVFNNKIIWK